MRIGYIVGSLSSKSINRAVAEAAASLAPEGVEFFEIPIKELGLYSTDQDANYPAEAVAFKQAIEGADGVVIFTPEYSRSLPGALKNALDWAARPWGTNSFNNKPVAITGASVGAIGTAAAQQHLRAILGHFNAVTLGQPETFVHYRADDYNGAEIVNDDTRGVLGNFVNAVVAHVHRHSA